MAVAVPTTLVNPTVTLPTQAELFDQVLTGEAVVLFVATISGQQRMYARSFRGQGIAPILIYAVIT